MPYIFRSSYYDFFVTINIQIIFFVLIDSFKTGVSQGLLSKNRLLILGMGTHLLHFSDIILWNDEYATWASLILNISPINNWYCIHKLDYISMAQFAPRGPFGITQGAAFVSITCNMEHSKMIWYIGT